MPGQAVSPCFLPGMGVEMGVYPHCPVRLPDREPHRGTRKRNPKWMTLLCFAKCFEHFSKKSITPDIAARLASMWTLSMTRQWKLGLASAAEMLKFDRRKKNRLSARAHDDRPRHPQVLRRQGFLGMLNILKDGPFRYVHCAATGQLILTLVAEADGRFVDDDSDVQIRRSLREWKAIARKRIGDRLITDKDQAS
jgi:hypothetical protein